MLCTDYVLTHLAILEIFFNISEFLSSMILAQNPSKSGKNYQEAETWFKCQQYRKESPK